MTSTRRSINKPLTILGTDRQLFFGALFIGAGMFIVFTSIMAGLAIFSAFWVLGRIKANDPATLTLLFNAGRFQTQYDPGIIRSFHVVIRK